MAHALAGAGGHSVGALVVPTDEPPSGPEPALPHDAADCPVCGGGRAASVALAAGAAAMPVARGRLAKESLPDTPVPCGPECRPEAARAPPARLVV